MRSIRTRTLALVLGLLGVSLALISWQSYRDARHEIEELFDARLAQAARLVAGIVSRDIALDGRANLQRTLDEAVKGQASTTAGHRYEGKLSFQVFDERGALLLTSSGAPPGALGQITASTSAAASGGTPAPALPPDVGGYHDLQLGEHRWRVFLLHDPQDAQWILAGERDDVRGELVGKIARRSVLPDLVGLPLLALLVWLAIGWSMQPLERMAVLIKARDPDNLSPLAIGRLPRELEPMVAALNRLLGQVGALLEREKRFLADAAHELRTPLAVLRIHAQNAVDAPDPQDRIDALRQLGHGVERATRLVSQLLTLARLEPRAVRLAPREFDLHRFVRNELAELIPLALARGQDLTLAARDETDYRLHADPMSLEILLQNLVTNAIQYSPPEGAIRVVLDAGAQSINLHVQDSGPGVPPDTRAKLFERFFREGPGTGAGLGLSIVQRIVELHGATITLGDSPLGGLDVEVRLPRGTRSPTRNE